MLVLLGFGVVHGLLIWHGDVLTEYALLGFVLVLFRRLSARQLLVAAVATYFIPRYFVPLLLRALSLYWVLPDPQPLIYGYGTFQQIAAQRVHDYLYWYGRWPLFVFPSFLVLFILGLWAQRVDLVSRLQNRPRILSGLLVTAIACAVAGAYLNHQLPRWWPATNASVTWRDLHFWTVRPLARAVTGSMREWGNSAAYAILFALLLNTRFGKNGLQPLAALGRMTLTTYLTQSIVCTILFYHYGLGWFHHVGYAGMFGVTLTLFTIQVVGSVWWLKHFRFGPAEWLWRSLAYRKKLPMQLVPVSSESDPTPS